MASEAAGPPLGSTEEKPPVARALWLGGEPDERLPCPQDRNHRIPKAALGKHELSCRLRRQGYSKAEEAAMYESSFFYEKAKIPGILMDKNLQFHIIKQATATDGGSYCPGAYSAPFVEVPQNHKRSICDLTQADRLAIYNYVLVETRNQRSRSQSTENDSDLFVDLAAKVNQDDGQKGPKSHLEILAEMRDYKRRRQSYRAKNVHITKKSYTEVIRDVIGVHMEELATHWQEENKNLQGCEDGRLSSSAKLSGRKEECRSASTDSRQSYGSSKDPGKQKKNQEKERDGDSRRKRERDEDKHHSHKKRK
ncbi:U11/U12 small nuclear ribonucleoprotein 48 kDa protein isoform X2 [Heteronotia binoei]|uniref:U11/U12 small nuclear ribonucleoprotein 48 kDa protein isoform X2 n=1 Tax=Heteronotia binoei TaxID=13085 RepID=UPI0029316FDA|nr:U11/U12 small nuclear ribonucleoprotein 48 kDa protein isoform X2 [Heteronotia binoei]